PALLPILVQSGAWTRAQAVDFARQIPSELLRSEALAAVARRSGAAEEVLLAEAAHTAVLIQDRVEQSLALAGLARHLSGPKRRAATAMVVEALPELPVSIAIKCFDKVGPGMTAKTRNRLALQLIDTYEKQSRPGHFVSYVFRSTLPWAS